MKNSIDLIGRLLLGFIFVYEAYDSVFYFAFTKEKMTYFGLTWNQDFLLVAAIILLILGGTLLLTGYRAQLGVILLLIYWIPVTFTVHSFWNDPYACKAIYPCYDRTEDLRRLQSILFVKNLAITGGLLMVYANGIGKYGIKKIFATARVPGK